MLNRIKYHYWLNKANALWNSGKPDRYLAQQCRIYILRAEEALKGGK